MGISAILLIVACLLALLATLGIGGRINLVAGSLACFFASLLLGGAYI